jgi:hypothetical protein
MNYQKKLASSFCRFGPMIQIILSHDPFVNVFCKWIKEVVGAGHDSLHNSILCIVSVFVNLDLLVAQWLRLADFL